MPPEECEDSRQPVADDQPQKFHIEEFKALRQEIAANVTRTVQIMQYVLLITALVYSFLLGVGQPLVVRNTTIPPEASYIVWCIPSVCSILGAMICYGSVKYITTIGGYLNGLERKLGYSDLGWEHYFDSHRKIRGQFAGSTIAWLIIIVLNILCAYWGITKFRNV